MYIVPVTQIDSKNILRMFSRTLRLFEQIPFGMNRDILKNPTWSGAKNSNISSCRLRFDAIGRLHHERKK